MICNAYNDLQKYQMLLIAIQVRLRVKLLRKKDKMFSPPTTYTHLTGVILAFLVIFLEIKLLSISNSIYSVKLIFT